MNSIFAVNINNLSELFENGLVLIEDYEKEGVLRFRKEKDRHRKLVSCLLIRYFLKEFYNLSEYKLSYNSYGKPYLNEYPDLNFNISHSGNWVVGAISNKPVGIDVEKLNEIKNFFDIAKRFFSIEEYQYLQIQPENIRLDIFYEIWTKKESLIKAVGKGLSIPLDSFTIPLDFNGAVEYDNCQWKVALAEFDDKEYKLSIASVFNLGAFLPIKYLAQEEVMAKV